jgi:DNA-directed RNA polymerase subunit D
MNIELGEEENGVLKARLKDSYPAVANALRRTMMARVHTLAIKEIDVVKNESGLFDEDLANRLGQVPFTIPKKFDEDDKLHIAIKKEGPGKVKSGDIQTDNEEAEPVQEGVDIVTLKEDQDLELEGTAVLGTGRDHAKHQGGTIGYEKDGDDFIFRIESTSGYTNEELLQASIDELKDELTDFEEKLEA